MSEIGTPCALDLTERASALTNERTKTMSNLAIRDLEHVVLDSAEMQNIKGGFPNLVNLFDVYSHPENYDDGIVQVARDYVEGN